jgi:hypothetical protein
VAANLAVKNVFYGALVNVRNRFTLLHERGKGKRIVEVAFN